MNTPQPELGDLLHDAVDGVEPADRIDEIRARTADRTRDAARPWFYAAGAVVLATAAAVTAFAVLGNDSTPSGHHGHDMATMPSEAPGTYLVPAYYVGDTPRGPRLYREFDRAPGSDALNAALAQIQQPPSDPDYRTPWQPGSFGDATIDEAGINVELNVNDLSDDLAVQQVVYTLQAAAGERLPVWFWRDGQRGNAPYDAAPQNDVLSLVSISDPAEGGSYEGTMVARGRANSFEGTVAWRLVDENGEVVREYSTTAAGMGDKLYPWETTVDLTGLSPGTYTFVASTDDPTGGEGPGPDTDTRQITVR